MSAIPRLGLILARSRNGVIGKGGTLPWHLPEDLAHFKAVTLGHPVLMGRKTWDSLPERFRPLPGRRNIVLTHQPEWNGIGAQAACSLPQALQLCEQSDEIWVIGGATLYVAALPLAARAEVTEIEADFEGDAFAPELRPPWEETQRTRHTAASGLRYSFVSYRNPQAQGV